MINERKSLRANVCALSRECRHEAEKLSNSIQKGKATHRVRGRAEALKRAAQLLERITASPLNLVPNMEKCILHLQEEMESQPVPRRCEKFEQRRFIAQARGRAGVYANVEGLLTHLLLRHSHKRQSEQRTTVA
jgi:hypothetical protein